MAKVFIPALLHQFTNNVSQIDVKGENVRTIVNNLDIKFPGIKSKLVEGLKIKPFLKGINEYLGELYIKTNRIDLAKQRLEVLNDCECEEFSELKELIDNN